jgi:hypothetical protein
MINNEYKGDDSSINGSVNTTSRDQKRINSRDDSHSISFTIEDIRRSGFQEHNLLIYPDLPSFRQIYSECAKQALDNNEIVFLATTYDSFDRMEDALKGKGISVDAEKKDGNLIIVDAVRAYQVDTYGALKLGKSLASRATREGKAGVFNMSDLGSFFLSESIDTLIEYEQSISKKMDFKFKAICSYHKGNFGTLTDEQQRALILGHNSVIGVKD